MVPERQSQTGSCSMYRSSLVEEVASAKAAGLAGLSGFQAPVVLRVCGEREQVVMVIVETFGIEFSRMFQKGRYFSDSSFQIM